MDLPFRYIRDANNLWFDPPNKSHLIRRRNAKSTDPLHAEEAEYESQLKAIRNFGSTWLKPPGIMTTLQSVNEDDSDVGDAQDEAHNDEEDDSVGLPSVEENVDTLHLGHNQVMHTDQAHNEEEDLDLDAEIPSADMTGAFDDESQLDAFPDQSSTSSDPRDISPVPPLPIRSLAHIAASEIPGTMSDRSFQTSSDEEDETMEID